MSQYNEILASMARVYGTAKICPYDKQNCNLATEGWNLDPEIEELISTSRDSAVLTYVWKAWRDASGKEIRDMYKEYIALSNKAAVENGTNIFVKYATVSNSIFEGLKDNGDIWLAQYEDPNFKAQVAAVWGTVEELYKQLYGYVRFRLREVYPEEFLTDTDPIPAHILGIFYFSSL
jgi:peptidyl-dipeptidase A